MKITNKLLVTAGLVVTCVAASAVSGYITVEHERIIASTIDSTPIGATVGSTGNFTGITFAGLSGNTGQFNNSLGVGTGYSELQISPGTTPPIRRGITWGLDPVGDFTFWISEAQLGAFKWRESITGNQLMSLDDGGDLLTAGNLTASGQVNSGGSMTAGGGFTSNGNVTINGGETLTGYLTANSGATITGTIYSNNLGLDGNGTASGNFTAGHFFGPLTGNVTGNVAGNATTASSLASTPGQCSNSMMVGITATGAPICSLHGYSIPMVGTAGCTTGNGSYNTCTTTISFSGFSDGSTQYAVTCNGMGASDSRAAILGVSQLNPTSFVVTTVTEGSVAVSYSAFSCIATHG